MGRYIEQNNPGGGDCGFYAFANGLIPYLQTELSQDNGETPLWNKLQELLDPEHRDTIKQQIKDYDFTPPNNRDPLSALNIALRKCLVDKQRQSIRETHQKIETLYKHHGYRITCPKPDAQASAFNNFKNLQKQDIESFIQLANDNQALLSPTCLEKIKQFNPGEKNTYIHAKFTQTEIEEIKRLLTANKKTDWLNILKDCYTPEEPLEIYFKLSQNPTTIVYTVRDLLDTIHQDQAITKADIQKFWENKKISILANINAAKLLQNQALDPELPAEESTLCQRACEKDVAAFDNAIALATLTPENLEDLLPTIFEITSEREQTPSIKSKAPEKRDLLNSRTKNAARALVIEDALAVFWHYFDNSTNRNELNSDAYRNPAFRQNMQSLATELKKSPQIQEVSRAITANSPEETKFRSALNATIIDRLLRGKMLAPLIEEKLRQGTWATASDLQVLAEHFGVEFQCHDTNHRNVTYGTVEADKPVIRLRNNASIHWTTLLDPFPLAQEQPEAEGKIVLALARKYMKQPHCVTMDEIRDMFQSYIPTRFGFFNNRHHVPAVRRILSKCNEEGATPTSILQHIANTIDKNNVKQTGDFQARLDYLALRVTGGPYSQYKQTLDQSNATVSTANLGQ